MHFYFIFLWNFALYFCGALLYAFVTILFSFTKACLAHISNHIVQIVVIHRYCNGLHGGFQFVLGQVALPNDEHLRQSLIATLSLSSMPVVSFQPCDDVRRRHNNVHDADNHVGKGNLCYHMGRA